LKSSQVIGLCLSCVLAGPPAYAQYIGSDSPVGLPTYCFSDETKGYGGKCFGIQWFRGRKLLLTTYHSTLSSDSDTGGRKPQANGAKITRVEVHDFRDVEIVAEAGPPIYCGGKEIEHCGDDWSEDMMAYELKSNPHLPLLPLASGQTPVGTKVWVLSKNLPSTDRQAERFPGVVTSSEPTSMDISMERKLTATGSSGAPIVNAKNELVGMLVGCEKKERKLVSAEPAGAIYARLYKALGR
jgi:hypothetical protein